MTGKILQPIIILVCITAGLADPVDTAFDLMEAIEYNNGYALEGLLTADLYSVLDGFIDQVRGIVETDPVLAEDLLSSRYGGTITLDDFALLNNQEILGLAMSGISLQPMVYIESEEAQLQGRSASVVIRYFDGSSVSFRMSWENSRWRVADSSLLRFIFD